MHAISEASLHAVLGDAIDPAASGRELQARVAFAAAAKVLHVQREMAQQTVALLDLNIGATLDRRV